MNHSLLHIKPQKAGLILICLISFFTYYWQYSTQNQLFWDENYYVPAAERYIESIAQFEGHPPLGKLLIASGELISGINKNIDKKNITTSKHISGNQLPNGFNMSGMRLMPSLFGMLTAMLVYGFFYSLCSEKTIMALLFSALYLFENAFIVHFRSAHIDSFQMFFIVLSLWYFLDCWKRSNAINKKHYFVLGLIIGMAIMVKINSILLLALVPFLYIQEIKSKKNNYKNKYIDCIINISAVFFSLLTAFALVFFMHLTMGRFLPDATTPAGSEDIANMSVTYRHYLESKQQLSPSIFIAAAQDYFNFMQKSHLGVPKLDICKAGENGSNPLHWPFMDKSINYRWDSNNGQTRYVQLAGNPVSWLLGLIGLLLAFSLIISHRVFAARIADYTLYWQIEIFTALYLFYMIIHLYLSSLRVMYLYHYFTGLLISYVLIVLIWQYLECTHAALKKQRNLILGLLVSFIFFGFLFISPLTYHKPLSKKECQLRNAIIPTINCL